MKGKSLLLFTVSLLLVLGLGGGIGGLWAKGPEAPGKARLQNAVPPVGTAFTYQGRLVKDESPVTATCDFRFSLWDAASSGGQIGSDVDRPGVSVSSGLFTAQLDFGGSAFTGDARWLGIMVKCPGDGDYIDLGRQALTPTPYALALPGLWTQQNATSPNLIGGYSGNSVTSGVAGATISGGGLSGNTNRVTDNYGTVGGGGNNQAGDGDADVTDAPYATVGGGYYNTASGRYDTVAGGRNNTASGPDATVGGGHDNTASDWATVGGGESNYARLDATVGGGDHNTASGWFAAIGGGDTNTASGPFSFIGSGEGNTASGEGATVPGGFQAVASHYGQMAYASGQIVNPGDAQTSVYVMRINQTCTAGDWYDLYLDGAMANPANFLTVAPGRTMVFDALVVGSSISGEAAGYYVQGVVENVGGTTAFISIPSVTTLGEDNSAWDVQAVASDGFDALFVQVKGDGMHMHWVATMRTAEVAW